jgi:crotonobetainyl-CoA:carnitine CoA-transferase CaiB-like acyl-CoA transferase
MSTASAARPLQGVRVLDLSRLLPGPFATMILSDLGADVIKIEDTGAGDYLRDLPPRVGGVGARFAVINRDKRSIAIDLKQKAGKDVFRRLCAGADVVLETFRPGVMDRLGLGYAELAVWNPRIILCSISGFGQTGPYRDRAGHDLGYIALAGVLALMGEQGGAPQEPGVQIADVGGGALWAAIAILGALYERTRTGKGQELDISMTDGTLAFATADLAALFGGASTPRRGAELLSGAWANYAVYETSDGKHLAVGALEPKFWLAFNQAIGRAGDIAELSGAPAEQERVRGEVAAILRTRTRAEWEPVFARVDACVEPVLELDELPAHPVHVARQNFFAIPGTDVRQVRTPVGLPCAHGAPPRQGEHTRVILSELGMSDAEIDALAQAGVVRAG